MWCRLALELNRNKQADMHIVVDGVTRLDAPEGQTAALDVSTAGGALGLS